MPSARGLGRAQVQLYRAAVLTASTPPASAFADWDGRVSGGWPCKRCLSARPCLDPGLRPHQGRLGSAARGVADTPSLRMDGTAGVRFEFLAGAPFTGWRWRTFTRFSRAASREGGLRGRIPLVERQEGVPPRGFEPRFPP